MDTITIYPELFKHYINITQVSLNSLARGTLLSRDTIVRIYNGEIDRLSVNIITKLGDIIGISPDSFSDYEPPPFYMPPKPPKFKFTPGVKYKIFGDYLLFIEEGKGRGVIHYIFRSLDKKWPISYTNIDLWVEKGKDYGRYSIYAKKF